MTYFYGKTKGLKADIQRHRQEESDLDAKIASLEGKDDPMSRRSLQAYRSFRAQLLASKAEVASKIGSIGKKKK